MIYLDMDGVLADFTTGFCRWRNISDMPAHHQTTWSGVCDHAGFAPDQMDLVLRQASASFWATLPVFPWAQDLVAICLGYGQVRILTAAVASEEAVTGKMRWLDKHFSHLTSRAIFCREKYLLARSSAVLIDDHDEQLDKFQEHGGAAIVFPQPWNTGREQIRDRLDFVSKSLDRVFGS
jgi:5'(3')-deoxyribonucleotidase